MICLKLLTRLGFERPARLLVRRPGRCLPAKAF